MTYNTGLGAESTPTNRPRTNVTFHPLMYETKFLLFSKHTGLLTTAHFSQQDSSSYSIL